MATPCDDLYKTYERAFNADAAADLSLSAAEDSLSSAEIAYAAALVAEVACAFTVETGPGFLLCESLAVAAAESAAFSITSGEKAVAAAQITADQTQQDMEDALSAYCDCINKQ